MPDGWETRNGLNHNDPSDATGDLDQDGISNLDEYLNGSNPASSDSDGDGMDDTLERQLGYDPSRFTRILYVDANRPDNSGDGLTPQTAKNRLVLRLQIRMKVVMRMSSWLPPESTMAPITGVSAIVDLTLS